MSSDKKINRRQFINAGVRYGMVLGALGLGTSLIKNSTADNYVWQLDPRKCTQCGRCATSCVLSQSAVKCVHVYDMCGYCDLCGGYSKMETKIIDTAAENQLCPTAAINRKYIEEPFFEYQIDEDLCIGCGICVKGCGSFGNGSLQLQVSHDLCTNCNQCNIATVCPSEAFVRVPADSPYLYTGYKSGKKLIKKSKEDNHG